MKSLRYYSKSDGYFYSIVFFLGVLFSTIHLVNFWKGEVAGNYWIFILFSNLLVILLAFLPKITYVEIRDNTLICKTLLFVRKEIRIASIGKIETCTSIYAGLKFTTARKGLIVTFNKYDDVLIGPKNEKEFLAEIVKHNPTIELKIKD